MTLRTACLLASVLLHGGALAAPLTPGETLPPLSLVDAHGKVSTLDAVTCRIYANGDRAGDALIADAMKDANQALLDGQHAVVVSDISDAPGFVRGLIRSSLRKRPYQTRLDQSGATRTTIPYRPQQVTIIDVADGRVVDVRFVADVDTLRASLGQAHTHAPATPAP